MNNLPRALMFKQARENGLLYQDYAYKYLPAEFTATLEFKVWGKAQNLKLYFQDDDGGKYVVSVFSEKYAPKNMPEFDMSSTKIQPGMKFRIKTETNRKGSTNFLEAHMLA